PLGHEVHGDHDTQYCRHDAEARQGIGDLVYRVGGFFELMLATVNLVLHHTFELMRGHVAGTDDTQVIGDEIQQVFGLHDRGVTAENLARLRIIDILFDSHNTLLAGFVEDLVEQAEQVHVIGFIERGTGEQTKTALKHLFDRMHRIGNYKRADSRSTNDQNLGRLPQDCQIAAVQNVSSQNARNNDHSSNNQ